MRRILIVEDNYNDKEIYTDYVSEYYNVRYRCQTGLDAISVIWARKNLIECAIIDYKLPDMYGIDVMFEAQKYSINCIVVSGYVDYKPEVSVPFLRKPFRREDLLYYVAGNEKLSA